MGAEATCTYNSVKAAAGTPSFILTEKASPLQSFDQNSRRSSSEVEPSPNSRTMLLKGLGTCRLEGYRQGSQAAKDRVLTPREIFQPAF